MANDQGAPPLGCTRSRVGVHMVKSLGCTGTRKGGHMPRVGGAQGQEYGVQV